jgi:GntR family transcriptional regulator
MNGDTVSITMATVQVKFDDRTPIYQQVAAELRRDIGEGEARPGERLPPAKDLAAVLGVNSNTVLRALRLLRDEGLLEFRRGRGVTVMGGAAEKSLLINKARELVRLARLQGCKQDELIQIIEAVR